MTRKLAKKIEWSSTYMDGTGNRMGHSEDSTAVPQCPACGGLKPFGHGHGNDYKGHKKNCEIQKVLLKRVRLNKP